MAEIMSEQVPGVGGQINNGLSGLMQMIMKLGHNGASQPGAPPAPGGSAGVNASGLPSRVSLPGITTMTPGQAGGPAARAPQPSPERKTWFHNAQEAKQASGRNMMQDLSSAIVSFKQQRFEKASAKAAQIGEAITQAQIIQANGGPKSESDKMVMSQVQQMIQDPKIQKILEKAHKDPMSAEYVGLQRAQQASQARAAQEAEIEKNRQTAERERQQGRYYGAQADYTAAEKGDIEREKIKQRDDAAKERAAIQKERDDAVRDKNENNEMLRAEKQGMKAAFDKEGKISTRPFTQAEIDGDPIRSMTQKLEKAKIDQAYGKLKQGDLKLAIDRERLAMQKKLGELRENRLQKKDATGKGYSTDEYRRMDLANIGHDYLVKMKDIVDRRPDLFGQGGWLTNKFKVAIADRDQDAMNFATWSKLASQPLVGVHGTRSIKLVDEMDDFNSGFYKSPENASGQLAVEIEAMSRMSADAGRPNHLKVNGDKPEAKQSNKPADDTKLSITRDASGRIIGVE